MDKKSCQKHSGFIALYMSVVLLITLMGCGTSGNSGEDPSSTAGSSTGNVVIGTPNATDVEMVGQWKETEVTPEGLGYALMQPVQMDDGTLIVYGKTDVLTGKLYKYTSVDNAKTWTCEEATFEQENGGQTLLMTMLPDSTCIADIAILDEAADEIISSSAYQLVDGKLNKIDALDNLQIFKMRLFDKNTLFVCGMDAKSLEDFYYVVDLQAGQISQKVQDMAQFYTGSLSGLAVDASNPSDAKMYYADYLEEGQSLCSMDKNGKIERDLLKLYTGGGDGACDGEGNYYFVKDGSIWRVNKSDFTQEQVMGNEGFELGLENFYCSGITYLGPTDFICNISDMTGGAISYKMMKYEWSEEPRKPVDTRLTVWSLMENATVAAAVVEFNKKNSGTEVTYVVGVTDDYTDQEDVIRNLNTEVMAGKGPDILILDGLDYNNYVDKGYLYDIAPYIEADKLLSGVTAPFISAEGECYVIPVRFSVPVLMGDVGDVDRLKSLEDLEAAVLACKPRPADDCTKEGYYEDWSYEEQYGLGFYNLEQLVDFTLATSMSELIVDGKVNHEALTEVMHFIGSVGGYYQMQKYSPEAESNGVSGGNGASDVVSLGDGGYEYSVTHHARYGWGSLETPAFFGEGRRNSQDTNEKSTIVVQPGLADHAYIPTTMAAVSATSNDPEEAGLFIETLLGDKVQSVCYNDGNPVLQSALTAKIEAHADYVKEKGYVGDMQNFYDSLKTPVTITGNNATLREYIQTHAAAMIKGEESEADAVRGVEDDAKMMFSEQ